MKVLGGNFQKGEEGRMRAFSLAQLTLAGVAAATVVLVAAALAIYLLNGALAERYFQQRAETLAGNLAYGIVESLQDVVAKVEGAALDAQVVAALRQKDGTQIAPTERRLVKLFPQAIRVRLIPLGATEGMTGGVFPQLSFADLEMLRAGEAGAKAPPVEAHFFGMEIAHVDIVRPVFDAGGVMVGQVLASYGGDFVQGLLAKVATPLGYAELHQPSDGRKKGVVLARRGDTMMRNQGAGQLASVVGTRWELRYWPPAAELSAVKGRLLAVWGVFGVVLLLLGLIAYGMYRLLSRAYQADLETIIDVVRDIHAGNASPLSHQPRLLDTQGTVELLEAMVHTGEVSAKGGALSATSVATNAAAKPSSQGIKQQSAVRNSGGGTLVKLPASIFRAYDIRGVVGQTLTEEIVYNIGRALGSEAFARGQQTIIIGRDGRLSGPTFAEALGNGLLAAGRDVIDIGQVPTPVLYFATHYLNTGSGVMVTGSHNPADYNGLKMVLRGETLAEGDIQVLRRRIEKGDITTGSGSVRSQDVIADYVATIVGDVQLARPLKVVVDCGNGVAGGVAPLLLRSLGCEVIELYCEVDGHFPNHHPDPSQLENLEDLIAAVRHDRADLGLAFDGDGDRLALVDGGGKVIWPDRQMMLYAKDVLARNPGAVILFDIKCSRHLAKYITRHGGQPLMWKTGHSLIKRKMKETGALLAGEMSGHIFFKERWFGFDDALYTAARLLEILAAENKTVAEVFQALPDAVSTPELRVDLPEGQQTIFMSRLLERADLKGAALTTIDGLRADFEDGWGLVRASNTTPSLIMRFEANNEAALKRIKEEFRGLMRKVDPKVALPF